MKREKSKRIGKEKSGSYMGKVVLTSGWVKRRRFWEAMGKCGESMVLRFKAEFATSLLHCF